MVLDEHKAKTSDLISQKIEENMEGITHLRAQLITEEQKLSEEKKRNEHLRAAIQSSESENIKLQELL